MRSILLRLATAATVLAGCASPPSATRSEDAGAAPEGGVVAAATTGLSARPAAVATAPGCKLRARYRSGARDAWKIPEGFVRLRPDGKELLVGCKGGEGPCVSKLEIWSLATGERRVAADARAADPDPDLTWAGWSADGAAIVTEHRSAVTVRDPADLELRSQIAAEDARLGPNGKRAIMGHRDGTAMLVDLATGKVVAKGVVGGSTGSPPRVGWLPDGAGVLVGDRAVELWDAETGARRRRLVMPTAEGKVPPGYGGPAIAMSRDGTFVVLASAFGSVDVFDAKTGVHRRRLRNPAVRPDGGKVFLNQVELALSPDGATLAMTYNSALELWDLQAGKLVTTVQPESASGDWLGAGVIAFDPAGKHVAWAGESGVVRVLALGQSEAMTFRAEGAQKDNLTWLSWSKDGRAIYLFASCGFMRRARGWALSTRAPLDVEGFSEVDPCRTFGADGAFSVVEELNVFQLTRSSDRLSLAIPKSVASASLLDVVVMPAENVYDAPPEAALVALGCETRPGDARATTEAELAPLKHPGLLKAFVKGEPVRPP
jgi:WD40 repeat protein